MSSEEEKFECPLCGIFGLEGEILNHLESCDGIKKVNKIIFKFFPIFFLF